MTKSAKGNGVVIPFPGTSGSEEPYNSATQEDYRDLDEGLTQMQEELILANEAFTLVLAFLNGLLSADKSRKVLKTSTEFRWGTLATLQEKGLISFNSKKKTITFTEQGEDVAMRTALLLSKDYSLMVEEERTPVPTFTFLLELDLDGRPCKRLLRVPQGFTFDDFHMAIQNAFGWMDYHMYDFRLTHNRQKQVIADPDRDAIDGMFAWFKSSEITKDARKIELDEIFPRTRKAKYFYDYGDGWETTITYKESGTYPLNEAICCEDGEGDAPPEDVGSVSGFERFLAILDNPKDPEYDEMIAWGEEQGFERFSLDAINERLAAAIPPTIYGV